MPVNTDPDIMMAATLLDEFMDKALRGEKPDAKAYYEQCKTAEIKGHFLKLAFTLAHLGGATIDSPDPEREQAVVIDLLQQIALRAA